MPVYVNMALGSLEKMELAAALLRRNSLVEAERMESVSALEPTTVPDHFWALPRTEPTRSRCRKLAIGVC